MGKASSLCLLVRRGQQSSREGAVSTGAGKPWDETRERPLHHAFGWWQAVSSLVMVFPIYDPFCPGIKRWHACSLLVNHRLGEISS